MIPLVLQIGLGLYITNHIYNSLCSRGPKGEGGPQGTQGDTGPQGIQGDRGDTGKRGDRGPQGARGSEGPRGDKGNIGLQGPQGHLGQRGVRGPRGDTGQQGQLGQRGVRGLRGERGYSGLLGERGNPLHPKVLGKDTSNGIPPEKKPVKQVMGSNGDVGRTIIKHIQGKIKKPSITEEVSNLATLDRSLRQSQPVGVPTRAIISKDGLSGSFTQVYTSSEKK